MTTFVKVSKSRFTWTGYDDDVIGHDRKLKKALPDTKFCKEHDAKRIRSIALVSFEKKNIKLSVT